MGQATDQRGGEASLVVGPVPCRPQKKAACHTRGSWAGLGNPTRPSLREWKLAACRPKAAAAAAKRDLEVRRLGLERP